MKAHRRGAAGWVSRALHCAVVTGLTAGLLLLGVAGPAVSFAAATPDAADIKARTRDTLDALARMRAEVDTTTFDLEALSLEMSLWDAADIVSWVEDSIAYQPYPGLLRGAEGTLLARAGNALDQSVLLAGLLKDAGFDAEIRRGRLDADRARALVRSTSAPPADAIEGDSDAVLQAYLDGARLHGLDAEAARSRSREVLERPASRGEPFLQASRRETQDLVSRLAAAGVEAGAGADADAIVQEARDYFWVAYREAPGDPWTDVHPAAPAWDGAEPVEVEATYVDTIPDELQHRFRFQAFIGVRRGTKVEAVPVTAPWERPAANLVDHPLTFFFWPSGLSETDGTPDAAAILASTDYFYPVLDGALAPGGLAFTPEGFAVDPVAAQSPAAGVFQTAGGKLNQAAGTLGGEGGDGAAQALTSAWIEYTLIAPGGEERVAERAILGTAGAGERPAGQPDPSRSDLLPLTDVHTIVVAPGSVPRGYAGVQAAQRVLALRPQIDGILGLDEAADPAQAARDVFDDVDIGWQGGTAAIENFDSLPHAGATVYRSAPTVLVHRRGVTLDDSLRSSVDIVWNDHRAISVAGGDALRDPSAVLRQGVWESLVEASVLPEGATNVASVFAAARDADAPILVLQPGEAGAVPELPGHEGARGRIAEALAAGKVVVVPSVGGAGAPFGWWEVEPASGNVRGVLESGIGGSEFVEYLAAFAVTGAFFFVLIHGFFGCAGKPSDIPSDSAGKLLTCGLCALFAASVAAVGVYLSFELVATTMAAEGGALVGTSTTLTAEAIRALVWDLTTMLIDGSCNLVGAFAS